MFIVEPKKDSNRTSFLEAEMLNISELVWNVSNPGKTIAVLNLVIRKLLAPPQVQQGNSVYITAESHMASPLLSVRCMHGLQWLLKQMRNAASEQRSVLRVCRRSDLSVAQPAAGWSSVAS